MTQSSEPTHRPRGFDAPPVRIEDDHLNRWPLAREVYSVAVNGPAEWSVRIAVYGEWGTGKTTVLKFVDSLAREDGNVVVWFDPWAHQTSDGLWTAFVQKVYEELETVLGGIAAAGDARTKAAVKAVLGPLGKILSGRIAAVRPEAAEAAEAGLDFLKGFFSFGPKDLKGVQPILGKRRVIILIDDLDRTAAELVPEILYALKQVMDGSGFSFVCAFDPEIVGKVLRVRHRGFGDGLKFLEKIIDYPVWLPPPTAEGLLKIALADRNNHCPFVPESEIRNSFPLLPQNPRAIRQFLRLLSLLKKQISRHYEAELRWPVIIAATVIRARYPKLAPSLLTDLSFLRMIGIRNTTERHSSEGQKVDKEIEEHIAKSAKSIGFPLNDADSRELHECMRRICDQMNVFLGSDVEVITYLASIVERPSAVTLKEFEKFLGDWKSETNAKCLAEWVTSHAKSQHRTEAEVARELTERSIHRYLQELRQADAAFKEREGRIHQKAAEVQLGLLEMLVLEAPIHEQTLASRDWIPTDRIFEKLPALADDMSIAHRKLWPRTKIFLRTLVDDWPANIHPLMEALDPFGDFFVGRPDGKQHRKMHAELCQILATRFAAMVVARWEEANFVGNVRSGYGKTRDEQSLLLDADGALWKGSRKKMLSILRKAKQRPSIQENAFNFLVWLEHHLRLNKTVPIGDHASKIAKDPVVFPAIWAAATVAPFTARYARELQPLVVQLKELGVPVAIPAWLEVSFEKKVGGAAPEGS